MTGELQRISCTGGGAREQGLLRVDDWMCCGGFVGSRDKRGSGCGDGIGQDAEWSGGLDRIGLTYRTSLTYRTGVSEL